MLSAKQFLNIFPNCKDPIGWVDAMNGVFSKYEIMTPMRQAAFLAQCGHESGGWRVFEENLNYSAKALNVIFKKYFENAGRDALEYERQPEKIANTVYANRMGNGDIDSGDGWKYRGRGPIQLTGRDNYRNFSRDMCVDAESNPDIVSENKEVALMSAIWFWNKHKLNDYADKEDIKGMTRIINGGYNGLEDRINKYEKIIKILDRDNSHKILSDYSHNEELDIEGVLRRGSKSEGVKIVQNFLNIYADGIFGVGTEIAVKQWQKDNGLYADGIVGPKTLEKMLG